VAVSTGIYAAVEAVLIAREIPQRKSRSQVSLLTTELGKSS
jgi:hypothetical protein